MRTAAGLVALSLTGCLGLLVPQQAAPAGGEPPIPDGEEAPDGGDPADGAPPADGATAIEGATLVDGGMDLAPACVPRSTAVVDGHHNAGQPCLGCHNGAGAPRFTVAGTLYRTLAGGAAVPSATIVMVDATGKRLQLVTAANGNFYTTVPVALPLSVRASSCPDDQRMVGAVSSGDCNACHDAALRAHLP